MNVWTKLGKLRQFVGKPATWSLHTDTFELGWGEALAQDNVQRAHGLMEHSGVWTAEELKTSFTFRELRALTFILCGRLCVAVQCEDVRWVRLFIDNTATG